MNIAKGKYALDRVVNVLRREIIPHTDFNCLSAGLTIEHCSALEVELNRQLEAFDIVKVDMKKILAERERAMKYSNTTLREEWLAAIDGLRKVYQNLVLDVKLDPTLLRAQIKTVPAQLCWFTVDGLPFYAPVDGEHLLGSVKTLSLSDDLGLRGERRTTGDQKVRYSQRLRKVQKDNNGSNGTLFSEKDFWNTPRTDGKVDFKLESIATGYIIQGAARRDLLVNKNYRRIAVDYGVHIHRVNGRGKFVGLDTAVTVSHAQKDSRVYRMRLETTGGMCSVSVADEKDEINMDTRAWNDPRKTMKEKHVINYVRDVSRVVDMITGEHIQGRQEKLLKKTMDKIIAYSQPKT